MKLTLPPSFLTWTNFPNLMKQLGESSLETQTNTNTKEKDKIHARTKLDLAKLREAKIAKNVCTRFCDEFSTHDEERARPGKWHRQKEKIPRGGERGGKFGTRTTDEFCHHEPPGPEREDWLSPSRGRTSVWASNGWENFCEMGLFLFGENLREREQCVREGKSCGKVVVVVSWISREFSALEGKVW